MMMNLVTCLYIASSTAILSTMFGFLLARYIFVYATTSLITIVDGMGKLIFLMPPIVTATVLLKYSIAWPQNPILSIILGHVFVFTLYAASSLLPIVRLLLTSHKSYYASLLRLSHWQRFWHYDLKEVWPQFMSIQVLILSMTSLSFSLVIILGQGLIETPVISLYEALATASLETPHFLSIIAVVAVMSLLRHISLQTKVKHDLSIPLLPLYPLKISMVLTSGVVFLFAFPVLDFFFNGSSYEKESLLSSDLMAACLYTLVFAMGIGFLCVIITLTVFAHVAVLHKKSLYKKIVKCADYISSFPKIALVCAVLYAQMKGGFGDVVALSGGVIILVMGYSAYSIQCFSGDIQDFIARYQVYMAQLKPRFLSRLPLILGMYSQKFVSIFVDVVCFTVGNLTVVLFLAPDTLPFLSLKLFDAVQNYNMKLAHLIGVYILIFQAAFILCPSFIGNVIHITRSKLRGNAHA